MYIIFMQYAILTLKITTLSQVAIEIPYILLETILFVVIAFPSIGFTWSVAKFLWFFYVIFCSLLFYVYFGMMLTALTPTLLIAQVLASVYHTMSNLFSGYIVPPQVSWYFSISSSHSFDMWELTTVWLCFLYWSNFLCVLAPISDHINNIVFAAHTGLVDLALSHMSSRMDTEWFLYFTIWRCR